MSSRQLSPRLGFTILSLLNLLFQVSVVGDLTSSSFLLPSLHTWGGTPSSLLSLPPSFAYLVYPGRYRLQLTYCGPLDCDQPELHETVFSDFINIQSSVREECLPGGGSNLTHIEETEVELRVGGY